MIQPLSWPLPLPIAVCCGQALFTVKSAALVPDTVAPVTNIGPVPVLVICTDCEGVTCPTGALPKGRLPEGLAASVGRAPVPDSVTEGLPDVLVVNDTAAENGPAAEGVNVTLTVHVPPANSGAPQVLVWENPTALAPVIEIAEMDSDPVPLLETVTVCAALAEPTN
jgi:hypothetical protein